MAAILHQNRRSNSLNLNCVSCGEGYARFAKACNRRPFLVRLPFRGSRMRAWGERRGDLPGDHLSATPLCF